MITPAKIFVGIKNGVFLKCPSCDYEWKPRSANLEPKKCPDCKISLFKISLENIKKKTCHHCGHVWSPRIPNPRQCPNCQKRLDKTVIEVDRKHQRKLKHPIFDEDNDKLIQYIEDLPRPDWRCEECDSWSYVDRGLSGSYREIRCMGCGCIFQGVGLRPSQWISYGVPK